MRQKWSKFKSDIYPKHGEKITWKLSQLCISMFNLESLMIGLDGNVRRKVVWQVLIEISRSRKRNNGILKSRSDNWMPISIMKTTNNSTRRLRRMKMEKPRVILKAKNRNLKKKRERRKINNKRKKL